MEVSLSLDLGERTAYTHCNKTSGMMRDELIPSTVSKKKCFLQIKSCKFKSPCRCVNSSCTFRLAPCHVSCFQAIEPLLYATIDKVYIPRKLDTSSKLLSGYQISQDIFM
jgi:hypothetical protein